MRVVVFERRTLRADPWHVGEVVPRRWAGSCPFERVSVAPWILGSHDLAVSVGPVHVVDERQDGCAEYERADRGECVQGGEAISRQVVGVPTWHALDAEP